MNHIFQGLNLSITGISLTFAALGLLILAMILLERLSRKRPLVPDEREIEETTVVSTLARDPEDEEIVAAIAVTLAHLRSLDVSRSGLGAVLESEHSPWWTMGRVQQQTLAPPPPSRTPHRPQGRK